MILALIWATCILMWGGTLAPRDYVCSPAYHGGHENEYDKAADWLPTKA